jgi:hypothetical protein
MQAADPADMNDALLKEILKADTARIPEMHTV